MSPIGNTDERLGRTQPQNYSIKHHRNGEHPTASLTLQSVKPRHGEALNNFGAKRPILHHEVSKYNWIVTHVMCM